MFPGVSPLFPGLETFALEIGPNVGQFVHADPVVGELMLLNATIHTAPPARLRALVLAGLTLWPAFSAWSDPTAATLQALASLELHFGFQADQGIVHRMRAWDRAFTGPSSIGPPREPARELGQWSLTHLVLSTSKEGRRYSAFPGMHDASFPNLVSLRISHMVFRHPDPPVPPTAPGTLEAFITRHPTLRTLVLDDCMLQKDNVGGAYRPWAALCRALSQILTSLVHLSVYRHDVHAAAGMHDGAGVLVCLCGDFPIGYASAPRGVFERSEIFYDPATAVRDMEALEALKDRVRDRAGRCCASR